MLVQLQEKIAEYPTWMVAIGVGVAVVLGAILLWKAMRMAITVLIVGVVIAGAWLAWDWYHQRGTAAPAPAALAPGGR